MAWKRHFTKKLRDSTFEGTVTNLFPFDRCERFWQEKWSISVCSYTFSPVFVVFFSLFNEIFFPTHQNLWTTKQLIFSRHLFPFFNPRLLKNIQISRLFFITIACVCRPSSDIWQLMIILLGISIFNDTLLPFSVKITIIISNDLSRTPPKGL